MTRSLFNYPMHRGMDADGGGAADLQTDVMRFMAILSLCLVAIFALVQSIPVGAPPIEPAPRPVSTDVRPTETASTEIPVPKRRSAVVSESIPRPLPAPPPRPAAEPVSQAKPPIAAAPAATPVNPPDEGFTLRFDSNRALEALVAREEIGLYAIAAGSAKRFSIERGRYTFWPASLPSQFHEMDADTVPEEVIGTLGRSGLSADIRWGVTLPSSLRRELDRFLSGSGGGELVISADGRMRLE